MTEKEIFDIVMDKDYNSEKSSELHRKIYEIGEKTQKNCNHPLWLVKSNTELYKCKNRAYNAFDRLSEIESDLNVDIGFGCGCCGGGLYIDGHEIMSKSDVLEAENYLKDRGLIKCLEF